MDSYYLLIETLKDTFEGDARVNTVTTGDVSELDLSKKNIFPLVHLEVLDSPYISEQTTALVRFNVRVSVLDIRDINKEINLLKFWYNDNRHDVLNETRNILKEAENKLIKDTAGLDITIASSTAAEIIYDKRMNVLDGWQQTYTLDVPDINTTTC